MNFRNSTSLNALLTKYRHCQKCSNCFSSCGYGAAQLLATGRLPPSCNRPDVPGNKLIPCSGQIPFLGPLTALSSLKQFSFLLWALLNVSLKVRQTSRAAGNSPDDIKHSQSPRKMHYSADSLGSAADTWDAEQERRERWGL